jgi:crotonobetainyl-CoA:carnitine CoA-transferase CaiB-like acyl-CoA transferase
LTRDCREARDIFLKLAAKADIVVKNFKAGTMDKLGVGYQTARAVKADVVCVSVTGWANLILILVGRVTTRSPKPYPASCR